MQYLSSNDFTIIQLFCSFIQDFLFFRINKLERKSNIFDREFFRLGPRIWNYPRIIPNNFSLIKMQPVLSLNPLGTFNFSPGTIIPPQILIPNSWLVRGRINRRSLRVSHRVPLSNMRRLSLAGRLPS